MTVLARYVDPRTGQTLSAEEGRRRVLQQKPVRMEAVNPTKQQLQAIGAKWSAELGRPLTKQERKNVKKIYAAHLKEQNDGRAGAEDTGGHDGVGGGADTGETGSPESAA